MNHQSSRSHVILQLDLDIRNPKFPSRSVTSSITLADLAGSECLEKTKTKGKNTREGGLINKSLLSLSTVIYKLSKKEEYVGFRESKLTRILQPVLTGNSMTSVICTVSPLRSQLQESINTLKFGACAGVIKKKIDTKEKDKSETSMSSQLNFAQTEAYEQLTNRLEELSSTIILRDQEIDMLRQEIETAREHANILTSQNRLHVQEVDKLQNEVSALLGDNNKLTKTLEDLSEQIAEEKDRQYRNMFDQQNILIRNMEEEIERLKENRREKSAIKDFDMRPLRVPFGNSVSASANKPPQGDQSQESEEYKESVKRAQNQIYEKLRSDLEVTKGKLHEANKEKVRLEKIIMSLRKDLEMSRKELTDLKQENNQANQPKLLKFSEISLNRSIQQAFDRAGNKIHSRIQASPTKIDLKKANELLQKKVNRLDRNLAASLEREHSHVETIKSLRQNRSELRDRCDLYFKQDMAERLGTLGAPDEVNKIFGSSFTPNSSFFSSSSINLLTAAVNRSDTTSNQGIISEARQPTANSN